MVIYLYICFTIILFIEVNIFDEYEGILTESSRKIVYAANYPHSLQIYACVCTWTYVLDSHGYCIWSCFQSINAFHIYVCTYHATVRIHAFFKASVNYKFCRDKRNFIKIA